MLSKNQNTCLLDTAFCERVENFFLSLIVFFIEIVYPCYLLGKFIGYMKYAVSINHQVQGGVQDVRNIVAAFCGNQSDGD